MFGLDSPLKFKQPKLCSSKEFLANDDASVMKLIEDTLWALEFCCWRQFSRRGYTGIVVVTQGLDGLGCIGKSIDVWTAHRS